MSKRNATILIIVILILLVLGGAAYITLFGEDADTAEEDVEEGSANVFPESDVRESNTPRNGTSSPQTDAETTTTSQSAENSEEFLKVMSAEPASGTTWISIEVERGTTTEEVAFLRYVDRATGHIYEAAPSENINRRISNTTIPRIQEAIWSPSGEVIIYRRLNDNQHVETLSITLVEPEEGGFEREVRASFLPPDIEEIAFSPSGASIFYLTRDEDGAQGFHANPDGSSVEQTLTSMLREWLIDWRAGSTILFTTKPSGTAAGYVYEHNPTSGSFGRVFGGISGLTALESPSGERILYSSATDSDFELHVFDRATRERERLPVETLSEKCTWSPGGDRLYCGVPVSPPNALYPDRWYQGVVSFNDLILEINTENDSVVLIANPEDFGVEVDVTHPQVSPDGVYLSFINKKDLRVYIVEL